MVTIDKKKVAVAGSKVMQGKQRFYLILYFID